MMSFERRIGQTKSPRPGCSEILWGADDFHLGIPLAKHSNCAVSGAVIHYHYLLQRPRLAQEGFYLARQNPRGVVSRGYACDRDAHLNSPFAILITQVRY